jgi:hypothetical protein
VPVVRAKVEGLATASSALAETATALAITAEAATAERSFLIFIIKNPPLKFPALYVRQVIGICTYLHTDSNLAQGIFVLLRTSILVIQYTIFNTVSSMCNLYKSFGKFYSIYKSQIFSLNLLSVKWHCNAV